MAEKGLNYLFKAGVLIIIYGSLQITREKALRKEGNISDNIKYNWFVPICILYSVSVFAQFVSTIFVVYSQYYCHKEWK